MHVKMNAKVEAVVVTVQAEVNATCPLSVLLHDVHLKGLVDEMKVEETARTVGQDQKDRVGAE